MAERSARAGLDRRGRFHVVLSPELRVRLESAADERGGSVSELVEELLDRALPALDLLEWRGEESDDPRLKRELAAASVEALGSLWDGEADAEWQSFRP